MATAGMAYVVAAIRPVVLWLSAYAQVLKATAVGNRPR